MTTGSSTTPIFIVGCPRSGTSLIRNLLRSHPNLTFPRESHFIPAFYRAYGDPRNEQEAIELATRILALSWIKRWHIQLAPAQFAGCRSFREVTSSLFEAWARTEGKPRWGDKTPHYVTEIPELLRLFPEAKIIHIYRDGRDVALSWLRAELEPGNLYMAATLWRSGVMAGRRAGAALPSDSYLEVQYERLLTDLPRTMRAVCEFLREPFCDHVLRLNSLGRPPGAKANARPISAKDVVPANVEKWKSQMSKTDRALFESVAGDLLEDLGYETEGRRRQVSPLERLFWRNHHMMVRLGRRLRDIDPTLIRTVWEFRLAAIRRRLPPA